MHTLLCGVVVPVAFWPEGLQVVVQALPMTHGLAAIRLVHDSRSVSGEALAQFGVCVGVGFGWLMLAILTFERFAQHGRRTGSIDFD